MKKYIAIFLTICSAVAVIPVVQDVTFAWDYPNSTEGMVFYLKERTGVFTNTVGVVTNALTITISNVVAGKHEWSVTASNQWGESDPSVPYIAPLKPEVPSNLKPKTASLYVPLPGIVERTSNLGEWEPVERLYLEGDGVKVIWHINATQPYEFRRAVALATIGAARPPLPK